MTRFRAAAAVLLATVLLATVAPSHAGDLAPDLDSLKWTARPLVIFADAPDDPRFVQQMTRLETDPVALEDRLVVVLVDTEPASDSALRQRLRPRGFSVVLIDIDGQVVQRRDVPVTVREIANTIDRMPSRRQETGSRRP